MKIPYNTYNIYNKVKNQIVTVLYDVVICCRVLYSVFENTTQYQHVVKWLTVYILVFYKEMLYVLYMLYAKKRVQTP